MAKERFPLWLFLIGIIATLLIPAMNADPVKKATDLAVFQPIEIPGMVLVPGNYVIKVPDPVTHADMVGFYNHDESQLIKLVRTIPKYRLETTDTTAITFEERTKGAPDAIKSWFFPGDNWGKEFVYEKAKPIAIAAAEPIAPTPEPEATAPAAVIETPEPTVAAEVPEETPVEVVEAAPPPEAPVEVAEIPTEELPKTATPLPTVALLGTGVLALGLALKRYIATLG